MGDTEGHQRSALPKAGNCSLWGTVPNGDPKGTLTVQGPTDPASLGPCYQLPRNFLSTHNASDTTWGAFHSRQCSARADPAAATPRPCLQTPALLPCFWLASIKSGSVSTLLGVYNLLKQLTELKEMPAFCLLVYHKRIPLRNSQMEEIPRARGGGGVELPCPCRARHPPSTSPVHSLEARRALCFGDLRGGSSHRQHASLTQSPVPLPSQEIRVPLVTVAWPLWGPALS